MKTRRIYTVDCSWCFTLSAPAFFRTKADAVDALRLHRHAGCGGSLKITTWIPWEPQP
jgi:hypothetical protein